MKTRIHADQWKCDGCERTEMVPVSADVSASPREIVPEAWLTGTTTRDFDEVTWHAHALVCVKKAIEAAFEAKDSEPKAAQAQEDA